MMTISLLEHSKTLCVARVDDPQPILQVTIERVSLITDTCYIWIKLLDTPSRGQLRKLRQHFNVWLAPLTLVCNVEAEREANVSFARFFGFRQKEKVGNILVMERAA